MTPRTELGTLIKKFTPDVAKVARAALAKVRKLTPGASELVYAMQRGKIVIKSISEKQRPRRPEK